MKVQRIKITAKLSRRSKKIKKQHLSSKKQQNLPGNQTKVEKTFNDLSDDCIEEFLRRLPIEEVAKMSMVNMRINTLSENYFKRIKNADQFTFVLFGDRPASERIAIENNVKAFGKYIENLQISGSASLSKNHFESLQIVNQHCGKSLQHLTLCDFNINTKTAANMRNLLQNIQTIVLDSCSTSKKDSIFDLLLKYCKNLRFLNVVKCKFSPESWLNRTYNQLESIYFLFDKDSVAINEHLPKFFHLNRQVKHVIFQAFLINLPVNLATNALNIENLTVGIHKTATIENFQPIFNLPQLKQLTVCLGFLTNPFVYRTIVEHFGVVNTLESFGLCEPEITKEMCQLIGSMTRLKALKFVALQSIDEEVIAILSSTLVNIDSIFLCGKPFTFKVIREFIEKFPRLKSLYAEVNSDITEKQLAEMIELRRNVAIDLYVPLTIYVVDYGSEYQKFVTIFQRSFSYNKYIKLVVVSNVDFTSRFHKGIVN